MSDIRISKDRPYTVTIVLDWRIETELDILREASKVLMREVIRHELNNDRPFNR